MDAREELERLEYEIRRSLSTYVIPLGAWADRVSAIRESLGKEQGEAVRWMCTDHGDVSRVQRVGWFPLYRETPPADHEQVLVDALQLAHDHMRLYLPHYGEKHNVYSAVTQALATHKQEPNK